MCLVLVCFELTTTYDKDIKFTNTNKFLNVEETERSVFVQGMVTILNE